MSEHHYPKSFTLGPDGPDVGSIGIGTWAWGDRMVWGYGGGYSEADLRKAFDTCVENGARFFDTAELYALGKSERFLGKFISQSGTQGIQVATKWFPLPWRHSPRRSIPRMLKKSLARLGLDHVDLYQIHWPSPLVSIEAAMEGLVDAVEQGITRTVGVSNYNAEQTRLAHEVLARRGIQLASNQIEYSLVHRQPEQNGVIDVCRELGVTVIAYSPLGMGALTGKYTPNDPPSGARSREYNSEVLRRLQPLIDTMREIGARYGGKTPAQVAINWVVAMGALPIPGVKNVRQAQDNLEAVNWALSDEDVAGLNEASQDLSK